MASAGAVATSTAPTVNAKQPAADRRHKALKGNTRAAKNDEVIFRAYPWGTDAKPQVESFEDLKDIRLQRGKLYSNMRPWTDETRKQKGQHYLQIMAGKIKEGERLLGANTKHWRAISKAESTIEINSCELETIDAREEKEMARHNKTMAEIRNLRKINRGHLEVTARDLHQTAEALKYGEPDEEVESDAELENPAGPQSSSAAAGSPESTPAAGIAGTEAPRDPPSTEAAPKSKARKRRSGGDAAAAGAKAGAESKGKAKRRRSSYQLYCDDHRSSVAATLGAGAKSADVSKKLVEGWEALPFHEIAVYKMLEMQAPEAADATCDDSPAAGASRGETAARAERVLQLKRGAEAAVMPPRGDLLKRRRGEPDSNDPAASSSREVDAPNDKVAEDKRPAPAPVAAEARPADTKRSEANGPTASTSAGGEETSEASSGTEAASSEPALLPPAPQPDGAAGDTDTTPVESDVTAQLAAHIHACCVDTAFKLYAADGPECGVARRVAQDPAVAAIRSCQAFQDHHRCEPNYELDAAELAALEQATGQPDLVRMKIGLAKAVFFPRDGAAMQISIFQP